MKAETQTQPRSTLAALGSEFSYSIPRETIRNSRDAFDRYDTVKKGRISQNNLRLAIRELFTREKLATPAEKDINYLLNSYDFDPNREVSYQEYRRILRQLGGYKTYDKGTIGLEKATKEALINTVPGSLGNGKLGTSNLAQPTPVTVAKSGLGVNQQQEAMTGAFQQGLVDKSVPQVNDVTAVQTGDGSYSNIFAPVPLEFKTTPYPFNRAHIKTSDNIFGRYNKVSAGHIAPNDLEAAIADFYISEGLGRPRREDISYLLHKYKFDQNHQITRQEFKRILKELGGFKTYEQGTISRQRYQLHPGPYPGQSNFVDPYLTSQPLQQGTVAMPPTPVTGLPTNFTPVIYPLSRNGLYYSKAVFKNSPINQHGYVDLPALEVAVRNIYAVDHQAAPVLNDIMHVLQRHNFVLNRSLTYKEFRRLLKELSGMKEYQQGAFGFARKLFYE